MTKYVVEIPAVFMSVSKTSVDVLSQSLKNILPKYAVGPENNV